MREVQEAGKCGHTRLEVVEGGGELCDGDGGRGELVEDLLGAVRDEGAEEVRENVHRVQHRAADHLARSEGGGLCGGSRKNGIVSAVWRRWATSVDAQVDEY